MMKKKLLPAANSAAASIPRRSGMSNKKPKFQRPVFKAPEIEDIQVEIEDVANIQYNRSYAFYGRAGTGKTTLSATFPGPILLIDMNDEGTDSVADVPGLKVIRVRADPGWPMIEAIYWDIKNNPAKYAMFKTIVLDTVTRMQQLCLEYYALSKGKKATEAGQWGSMSKSDWGVISGQMKEWITSYRDLPLITVFLAQDKEAYQEEDEAGRKLGEEYDILPEIGPSLMKSVAKDMCSAVHVIGYTFLRENPNANEQEDKKRKYQYCLRVGPHPVYSTKFRKPKTVGVPELLVNPTYEEINEIMKGQ